MADWFDPQTLEGDFMAFESRIDMLRTARDERPGEALDTLDATLLELECAHEELRVCVEEIAQQRSIQATRAASDGDALAGVFARLSVPFLLMDRNGMVRRANAAAVTAIFPPLVNLVNRLFVTVLERSSRRTFRDALSAATRSEAPVTTTLAMGGSTAVVTLWQVRASRGHPLSVAAVISQCDERPEPQPVDTGYPRLVRSVRERVPGLADCMIVEVAADPGGEHYRLVALGDPVLPSPVGTRLLVTGDDDFWEKSRYLLRTGTPIAEDAMDDEDVTEIRRVLAPLTRDWNAVGGSLLGMPLWREGRPCGSVVAVRGPDRKPFDETDWGTLQEIAAGLTEIVEAPTGRPTRLSRPDVRGLQVGVVDEAVKSGGRSFHVMFSAGFASWFAVVSPASSDPDVAGLIKHALPVLARVHEEPAAVLAALDGLLVGQGDHGGLLTAVLGRYAPDRRTPALRLASAGHSPAIMVEPDGSATLALGGGMPLGLFQDAEPVSQDISLAGGRLVLLMSNRLADRLVSSSTEELPAFGPLGELAPLDAVQDIARRVRVRPIDDLVLLGLRAEPGAG